MKRILLIYIALLFFSNANAQTELKLNPIGSLFGAPKFAIELGVEEFVGIEGSLFLNLNENWILYENVVFEVQPSIKYYFAPKKGMDGWNTAAYFKLRKNIENEDYNGLSKSSTNFSIGFFVGHKWISKHNIIFEVNGGLGRILSEKSNLAIDYVGVLSIGYRFNSKKPKK